VAQLYPQALGYLFVASYDSQGYGGGIRPRLHMSSTKPESESELLYDWRFTADQFILGTRSLRHTTSIFFLQMNTCGYSPYLTSFLTRGWVCRLQLLLVLDSAVILGSKSRGTHEIFYCLKLENLQTWRARSLYSYPPGTALTLSRL
jgi:hypothetical protein